MRGGEIISPTGNLVSSPVDFIFSPKKPSFSVANEGLKPFPSAGSKQHDPFAVPISGNDQMSSSSPVVVASPRAPASPDTPGRAARYAGRRAQWIQDAAKTRLDTEHDIEAAEAERLVREENALSREAL